jgi:hypothetical protein
MDGFTIHRGQELLDRLGDGSQIDGFRTWGGAMLGAEGKDQCMPARVLKIQSTHAILPKAHSQY